MSVIIFAIQHRGIASTAVLTGYEFPEVVATAEPDVTVRDLAELRALHFPG